MISHCGMLDQTWAKHPKVNSYLSFFIWYANRNIYLATVVIPPALIHQKFADFVVH